MKKHRSQLLAERLAKFNISLERIPGTSHVWAFWSLTKPDPITGLYWEWRETDLDGVEKICELYEKSGEYLLPLVEKVLKQ